jgi:hypothetical protein
MPNLDIIPYDVDLVPVTVCYQLLSMSSFRVIITRLFFLDLNHKLFATDRKTNRTLSNITDIII